MFLQTLTQSAPTTSTNIHAHEIPHTYTWRVNRDKTDELWAAEHGWRHVVRELVKDDRVLFTKTTGGMRGMGCIDDNPRNVLTSIFCMHDIICADLIVLDESGTAKYELPGPISPITDYMAFPWVVLDNYKTLFHLVTRQRVHSGIETAPYTLGFFNESIAFVLSDCHATALLKFPDRQRVVFLYKDVAQKLSCLLGVLPMDALNEVYRFTQYQSPSLLPY